MASKSLGWACAAILIGSTVANAQVDLSQMLGSLTFGGDDPPSVAASEPPADSSAPVDSPPIDGERLQAPLPPSDEGPIGGSGLDDYWQADQPEGALPQDLRVLPVPPRDRSEWAPLEGETSLAPHAASPHVGRQVDLQAMCGEPAMPPAGEQAPIADVETSIPARPWLIGTTENPHVQGHPVPLRHGYSGGPVRATRVPHPTPCLEFPNLPPAASPEGFYRTPACYRNLWSGYAEEKAHHCQTWHRHLHGHCQCMKPETCACGDLAPQVGFSAGNCPSVQSGDAECAQVPRTTQQR